jgi:hypothetical protein
LDRKKIFANPQYEIRIPKYQYIAIFAPEWLNSTIYLTPVYSVTAPSVLTNAVLTDYMVLMGIAILMQG